jgi:diguanylate cyclase (GGDEF)-like protein
MDTSQMARRTHLRSRVFAITAMYGAMLLVIAFVLTSEGRESSRRAERLVAVDVDAVSRLELLVRNQMSFQSQWESTAASQPEQLAQFAHRYRSVLQLIDDHAPATGADDLLPQLRGYQELESSTASRWSGLDEVGRQAALEELRGSSRAIADEASQRIRNRKEEIAWELPRLEERATNLMWIALAIAWVIAIISFAIARLTLAKVVRPLEELSNAAEQIAAGDLEARAPVGGDHEIARLGTAFNRMADALASSLAEQRERARTDELTRLPNFRAFREILDVELERAARYGHHFAILVLDLDRFKQYNDRYGHLAGNEALTIVAATMRSSVRTVDYAARYGGEEFAVVLPEIDIPGMAAIAERVRVSIQDLVPPPGRDPLTVSIGGAIFPADGLKPEELFAAADRRLYEAKEKGRNCSVIPRPQASASLKRA